MKQIVILMILSGFLFFGYGQKVWKDAGGYVIIEVEDTESNLGKWVKKTNVVNYTGSSHLEFTGNGINGGNPNSPLKYKFKIDKGGIFEIKLRAYKRLEGEPADKCNDCYIKLAGSTFESGANNVSLEALMKDSKCYVHGESAKKWDYAGQLDTHGADHVWAKYKFFDNSTFTLTVSGRSIRYNLDRIIFHTAAMKEKALDPNTPQTLEPSSILSKNMSKGAEPLQAFSVQPLQKSVRFVFAGITDNMYDGSRFVIYTVSGETVNSFPVTSTDLQWDRMDTYHNEVNSGVYIGRLITKTSTVSQSFVLF